MRVEDVALVLLALVFLALLGTRYALPQARPAPAPATSRADPWRYDAQSPYYGFLPQAVQQYRSQRPAEVARAVCAAFGGELDFVSGGYIEAPARIAFNCQFQDGDMTISVGFGDLSRIQSAG